MRRIDPVLAVSLVLACSAEPDPLPPGTGAKQVQARLDRRMTTLCGEFHLPGAVLGLRDPDGHFVLAACGHSDVTGRVPMETGDRMRIGSVNKTFTAAMVLQLVDEGAISLDDTVASFGIEIDGGADVTVRQLLTHTSGLREYGDIPGFDWERAWTLDELLALTREQLEPAFAPGAAFRYSGTGYVVLSAIVAAEGRPAYPEALRSRLLDPLGLRDSFLEAAEPIPGGIAEGTTGFPVPEAAEHGVAFWTADGSLVSTAADLLAFHEHLFLDRDVLTPSSLAAMTTPARLPDGSTASFLGSAYGMGIEVLDDPAGAIYWHAGLSFGFLAYAGTRTATSESVVLLTNTDRADIIDVRDVAAAGWDVLRGTP